jgi:hypothetical protein
MDSKPLSQMHGVFKPVRLKLTELPKNVITPSYTFIITNRPRKPEFRE